MPADDNEYRIEEDKEPKFITELKGLLDDIEIAETNKKVQAALDANIGTLFHIKAIIAAYPKSSRDILNHIQKLEELTEKMVTELNPDKEEKK